MAAFNDLYRTFIYMIDPARLGQKESIYHIGAALQNQKVGGEVHANIFESRALGQRFRSYSPPWLGVKMPQLTVKTLAWLAHIDAPLEYQKWHQQWIQSLPTPTDPSTAAHLFYAQNWLGYTYTPKGWFKYNGLYWDPLTLNEWVSEIITVFEVGTDKDLMVKLQNSSFMSRMLKHLERLFEAPSAMDTNLHLLGLADGILDFTHTPPLFRKPFPEDMISKYSSFKFTAKRDPVLREELDIWLDQMFEHWVDLDRFLTSTARFLTGIQELVVWDFESSATSGRSTMRKLLQLILGATFEQRVGRIWTPTPSAPLNMSYTHMYKQLIIPRGRGSLDMDNYAHPHTIINFKGQWVGDSELVPKDSAHQYERRIFKRDPTFADRAINMAPALLDLLLENYRSK